MGFSYKKLYLHTHDQLNYYKSKSNRLTAILSSIELRYPDDEFMKLSGFNSRLEICDRQFVEGWDRVQKQHIVTEQRMKQLEKDYKALLLTIDEELMNYRFKNGTKLDF